MSGCATSVLERAGDRELAAGHPQAAAEQYQAAMAERPIMDFDFKRLRDKRMQITSALGSAKLDAATAAGVQREPLAQAVAMVRLRAEIGTDASQETVDRATREAAAATDPARGYAATAPLATLLELYQTAKPWATVAANLAQAIATRIDAGFPDLFATSPLDALDALLAVREAVRGVGVPATVDVRLDAQLGLLGAVAFPLVTADASAVFERATALRDRARALAAPPGAIGLAGRAQDAAVGALVAQAEQLAADHRYVAAFDLLAPRVARVDAGSVVRARLHALIAEAVTWYGAEGSRTRGSGQLLELALARALSTDAAVIAAATRAKAALAADWQTSLRLQPTVSRPAECAGAWRAAAAKLAGGTHVQPIAVTLRCSAVQSETADTGHQAYSYEEQYTTQELVVHKTRTYDAVGTHPEPCTKKNSFNELVEGTCDVPFYDWRDHETKTLETVTKLRDVTGAVDYPRVIRTVTASITAGAQLTWEDGSAHAVEVTVQAAPSTDAHSYTMPPRRLGDTERHETHTLDPRLTPAHALEGLGAELAAKLATAAETEIRAHRATRARADGAAALARGDAAAAGDAFVRSVLLDNQVQAEAAAWFQTAHQLDPEQTLAVLGLAASTRPEPPVPAIVAAVPYDPGTAPIAARVQSSEEIVQQATHATSLATAYDATGIVRSKESVAAYVGLSPYALTSAAGREGLVLAGAIELAIDPIELVMPVHRGPTLHDELGGRVLFGAKREATQYMNGDDEGKLSWGVEGWYRLFAGIRTRKLGLFAGGSVGYLRLSEGDTKASGGHVEPAVRITLRIVDVRNVVVEASGFGVSLGDHARTDRVAISVPMKGKSYDLRLTAERTELATTSLATSGETRMDLGRQAVTAFAIQIGGRL